MKPSFPLLLYIPLHLMSFYMMIFHLTCTGRTYRQGIIEFLGYLSTPPGGYSRMKGYFKILAVIILEASTKTSVGYTLLTLNLVLFRVVQTCDRPRKIMRPNV